MLQYSHFTSVDAGRSIDKHEEIWAQVHQDGSCPGHVRAFEEPEVWSVQDNEGGTVNGIAHCIKKFGRGGPLSNTFNTFMEPWLWYF